MADYRSVSLRVVVATLLCGAASCVTPHAGGTALQPDVGLHSASGANGASLPVPGHQSTVLNGAPNVKAALAAGTPPVLAAMFQNVIIVIAAASIGILVGVAIIGYFVYKSGFGGAIAKASGADGVLNEAGIATPDPPAPQSQEGGGAAPETSSSRKWYNPFKK